MKAMRDSCRTFELFELSRLFLSKSDRFVAKVHPKENSKPPEEGATAQSATSPFYLSVPDGLGFETEAEAIDHVLGKHMGEFFDIEEVEKEPPNGTFNVVNRCTVTGTLLAPPNYHRYRDVLQEHFASKIHGMSRERFESKIETLREQEAVDQWLESMKKGFNYKAKDNGQEFQHMEEARRHLLMNHKSKVVRPADMVRIEGKDLQQLPNNRIRRSIEAVLEKQIRVPLDFSNHLRGRLRRANFTIYKRGGKGGITYACSVKRQHRTPETSFSDSIQELVEFIEKNPDITAQHILKPSAPPQPEEDTPAESAKPTTEEPATSAEAPASAESSSEPLAVSTEETVDDQASELSKNSEAAVPEGEGKTSEKEEAPALSQPEGSQEAERTDDSTTSAPTENQASPKPSSEAKTDEKAKSAPAPEPKAIKIVGEIPASETLGQDLRWLIQYGYVTEFSDGRLYAPAVRTEQPAKEKAGIKQAPKETAPAGKEPGDKDPGKPAGTEAVQPSGEASESRASSEPQVSTEPAQKSEEPDASNDSATEPEGSGEDTVEPSPAPGDDTPQENPTESAGDTTVEPGTPVATSGDDTPSSAEERPTGEQEQ